MSVRTVALSLAGGAGILLGSWGVVSSVGAVDSPDEVASSHEVSEDIVDLAPVLGEYQEPSDELPDQILSYDLVTPSSARFIGEDDGVRYWLGLSEQSEMCVVVLLPPSDSALIGNAGVTGISCVRPAQFSERGISMTVDGHDAERGVAAHALPAGARLNGMETASSGSAEGGVGVVGRDGMSIIALETDSVLNSGSLTVSLSDGSSFVLPGLPECGQGCSD
ncbi:hypothetical protein ACPYO6_13385 [Georgenia sp. Z1344]|uniref:hypothetical protein n=1 Tax=Georgenia sp. Z1344 TaxID=3416706 RepID=UPI003CEBB20B